METFWVRRVQFYYYYNIEIQFFADYIIIIERSEVKYKIKRNVGQKATHDTLV